MMIVRTGVSPTSVSVFETISESASRMMFFTEGERSFKAMIHLKPLGLKFDCNRCLLGDLRISTEMSARRITPAASWVNARSSAMEAAFMRREPSHERAETRRWRQEIAQTNLSYDQKLSGSFCKATPRKDFRATIAEEYFLL